MRKLIMKMSISLDGFVCDANGGMDWVFKTGDEKSLAWSAEAVSEAGRIIMGRKSFEQMAPYWPTAAGPFAAPMNEIPKAVFTKKGYKGFDPGPDAPAAAISWTEARVFDGDLAVQIKELKAESGKPIIAIGGAGFMRSLIATGLIDEYILATHPAALGSGQPIFTNAAVPLYLRLVDAKTFPGGTIAKTFQPVG